MTDKEISAEQNSEKNERQSASWDLQNAIRNYSTLVATQIAVAFFSFASAWLATRYLGTEGYGGVVAVIAASQVAQIFVNWTCVALARYGVEEFVESGKISKTFWARTLIFLPNTLIFLALSFLWLPLISSWLKLPAEAIWYIAAHFLVTAVWLHIQHALQGAKLPRLQGILLAVERFLIFSGLLGLVFSGKLTYLSAVVIFIVSPLLMAFVGIFQLRKFIVGRIGFETDALKKILKFSVPLIPFYIVGYLSTNYLDAIFISQDLSKSDLGVYAIAYQINGILMQFPTLAGSLLLPFFVTLQTSGSLEKLKVYMEDILPLLTFAGAILSVCVAFAMQILIPLVFGQEVGGAVIIFWILMSSAVLAIPVFLGYAPYSNSISVTYIATLMGISAAIVNLTANFLLIPRYGLKGCAWATVLASAASVLTAIIIGGKRFKLRLKWTLPAVLPALFGSASASWTENLWLALVLAFASAFAIVLLYRNSFVQSVKLLSDYRKLLSNRT